MARPWYPFYWSDYVSDTRRLSMLEHGAYLLLMAEYYQQGEIPANAEQLHRVCMAFSDAERAALQSVLEKFFDLRDGVYRHARIDAELVKANTISDVRRNAARKRHTNAMQSDCKPDAIAMQKHTQSQPQPQPQEEPPITPPGNPWFDEFWSAYGKKVDRPAAERAWKRAKIPAALLPVVMAAVDAYVAATPDKQFRKNPATWLNNRGWENEVIHEADQGSGKRSEAGKFFDTLKDYATEDAGTEDAEGPDSDPVR